MPMYNRGMDLNELNIFVKVVESGSFTKAALSLDMPKSTVSSKISDLESRLGVSLIKRTTRKLNITPEGRRFFERCQKSLEELKLAAEELNSETLKPHGLLRVTAPIELGSVVLPLVIEKYRKSFPEVNFEVYLSDRRVDLVAEGFDVAIRAGELKDSSLMAKKLGEVFFAPIASPSYLKQRKTPLIPKDLEDHDLIQMGVSGGTQWELFNGKKRTVVSKSKGLIINEFNAAKTMVMNGLGIALLPSFLCAPEVRSGKLVRLLPEWRSLMHPVHVLYASHKQQSIKISQFIEIGGDIIKSSLKSGESAKS